MQTALYVASGTLQVNELRTNEPQCQIHLVSMKADSLDNGSITSSGKGRNGGGGGKCAVSPQAARKFADGVGGTLYSTSAKTDHGVGVRTA
jgi:hypothetical protein